jgi:hypothetical protein
MACPSGVLVEEKDVLWKDKSTKAVFRRTERETMLNLAFVSIRHHSWQISHYVEVADPSRNEALGSNPLILTNRRGHPKLTIKRSKLPSLVFLETAPRVRPAPFLPPPSLFQSKMIDYRYLHSPVTHS